MPLSKLWTTFSHMITIHELIEKGKLFYRLTLNHMASSIQYHFGDSILITWINGKWNAVTFQYIADSIITEFYRQPNSEGSNVDKIKIVQTAVTLLPSDIKLMWRITTGWRPRFLSNVIPKWMPWVFSRDLIYSIAIYVSGKEYWQK